MRGGIEASAVKELAATLELRRSRICVAGPQPSARLSRVKDGSSRWSTDSGCFIHKRQVYIAMDRYACDAMEWAASQPVPGSSEQAIQRLQHGMILLYETLRCLARLHARGWMHRDVKPGNILLRHTAPAPIPSSASSRSESAPIASQATRGSVACADVVLADLGLADAAGYGPGTGSNALLHLQTGLPEGFSGAWTGSGFAMGIPAQAQAALADAEVVLTSASAELLSDEWQPHAAGSALTSLASAPEAGLALPGTAEDALRQNRRQCAQAGTLFYRSPELLFGSQRHGAACDVWAAAMCGWELLAGSTRDSRPLVAADSGMGQIAGISRLLGRATADAWPGKAVCTPYMATAEDLKAASARVRRQRSTLETGGSGPGMAAACWWEMPSARAALPSTVLSHVSAVKATLHAKLMERLRSPTAIPAPPGAGAEGSAGAGESGVRRMAGFPSMRSQQGQASPKAARLGASAASSQEGASQEGASREGASQEGASQEGASQESSRSRLREMTLSLADLLAHMLIYDPDLRPSASACLSHPCFSGAAPLSDVQVPVPMPAEPLHVTRARQAAERQAAAAPAQSAFRGMAWSAMEEDDDDEEDDDEDDDGSEERAGAFGGRGRGGSLRMGASRLFGAEGAAGDAAAMAWAAAAPGSETTAPPSAGDAARPRVSLVPAPSTTGSHIPGRLDPALTQEGVRPVMGSWDSSPVTSGIRRLGAFQEAAASSPDADDAVPARLHFDAAASPRP
jgi:serine/threonine protein kinase